MNRKNSIFVGVIVASTTAGTSLAGAPALTIDANLGGVMEQILPVGVMGENGYSYQRDINTDPLSFDVADGTIDIGWGWLADPSSSRGASGPVSLVGGLTVANNTMATQTISFQTTLPLFSAILPSSVIGGSMAATVTSGDLDGATLSTNGSTALYQGMIDGVVVPLNAADLLPAPSSVSVGGLLSGNLGPDSFGDPVPSQSAGAINASIGILVTFDLTPGDSMSFTSVFAADIPAPGSSMAMITAIGAIGMRRRRR